jgi:O-antigen ligase
MPEGVPIFERFQQIMESPYAGIAVFALFMGIAAMVIMMVTQSYRSLLFILMVGQAFSTSGGLTQGILTLMRFAAMLAILILAFRGLGRIRAVPAIMILYATYLLMLTPMTGDIFLWSMQRAVGLFVLAVGIAGATAAYAIDYDRIRKTMAVIVVVAIAWACVNLAFGGAGGTERGSGQARFVGVATRTGGIAEIGGVLTPFLLWGFLQPFKRFYRYVCLIAFMICIPMLVYIGQRIGLFSAFIGMLPLIAMRLGVKRLVGGGVILLASGFLTFQLVQILDPHLRDFLMKKYVTEVTDTSGRAVRWEVLFQACLSAPMVPHGCGASSVFNKIHFGGEAHNSYLNIWYDGGFQAVVMWLVLMAITVWRCMKLLATRISQTAKETVRLLMGTMAGLAALAFFESSLDSPTNLNIGLFLLTLSLVDRMYALYLASHPSLWEWRTEEEGQLPGIPSVAGAY